MRQTTDKRSSFELHVIWSHIVDGLCFCTWFIKVSSR